MNQDEFIFDTFDEAMKAHTNVFKLCRVQGYITYADYLKIKYNKPRKCPSKYINYGWTHLYGSVLEPYGNEGKWILKMPKIRKIK